MVLICQCSYFFSLCSALYIFSDLLNKVAITYHLTKYIYFNNIARTIGVGDSKLINFQQAQPLVLILPRQFFFNLGKSLLKRPYFYICKIKNLGQTSIFKAWFPAMKHYIQAERFLCNLVCKPRAALLEAEMGMGGSLSTLHPTNVRQPGTAFTRTAAIRKLTTCQRLFLNDQVSHLSGALGVLVSPHRAV